MKKMLGFAAIIALGAPVVQASVSLEKEPGQLTTKEQMLIPHSTTTANFDRSRCSDINYRFLPQCGN
ncbi:hypothetical protein P5705_15570 [Pseudomonas entomophila]|uniref:hypothetical protein n=1 Tax=Pseudomonas entomophila TaxID=312306 RepID=UPI0024073591|nr:hypothetical protein [Pseudomonas entomophila]MDF9619067.1 hypothetical protein [Pseudomonas entomophila]